MEKAETDKQLDFCTLGMFIIDEIHFKPPIAPVTDILGGAGSYSALGARLFSAPPLSRSVGWIVDAGSDFPEALRCTLASWGTSCLIRESARRLTTRGWNGYGENEERAFRYTTPKLRLDAASLTPALLRARSFHLICSPERCVDLVTSILARREEVRGDGDKSPLFIWEPVPDLCTPKELSACYKALKYVDVVSPNHSELCGFFGKRANDDCGDVITANVEECCNDLLGSGIGTDGKGAVVVRAGKEGCFVVTRERSKWLPAYHQSRGKVIDPTGGGNTFLGGFAVGLVRQSSGGTFDVVVEAAAWGSVAASFAIEQVGMPDLNSVEGDREEWNGVSVQERLTEYRQQVFENA